MWKKYGLDAFEQDSLVDFASLILHVFAIVQLATCPLLLMTNYVAIVDTVADGTSPPSIMT